jgi:hypothetical protein
MNNYNLQRVYLFSPSIWRTRIPPELYDKEEILKTIEENYNVSPVRNNWGDPESRDSWHHTYGDEDNPNFKKVSLDKVNEQYGIIVREFIDAMKPIVPINYHYRVSNITANKKNQSMKVHNHLSKVTGTEHWSSFNAVHYMNFKKGHPGTKILNPSMFAQYFKTFEHVSGMFDPTTSDNTEFTDVTIMQVKEDDIVIMPSYLNHGVDGQNVEIDDLRVTVVINIWIERKDEQN